MSSSDRIINDFFRKSRRIEDQLPIALSNGSLVEDLGGPCLGCERTLLDVRGDLRRSIAGWRMTAFGYCRRCNLITPLMCEVVPDEGSFRIVRGTFSGWDEGKVISFEKK